MTDRISNDWNAFAKPIKCLSRQPDGTTHEEWLLAWRLVYEDQRKAFEPLSIAGIEYLDWAGDIFWWEDIEILEG